MAPVAEDYAVWVEGLCKSYGPTLALDQVSFQVPRGKIFAYLGPNGAGKTTTINLLCGLLAPEAGRVMVRGLDVARDPVKVKGLIGVVPDDSNLYPELTCRRNLEYMGELYGLPRRERGRRVAGLLETFGLADRAGMPFRALSRGLKRRLVLAAALVHSPQVLFLDEPTIGLDVPSARNLRQVIRRVNREGATVFLTTHNLAEAGELAQTVCILVRGRVVAVGSPEDIRHRVERGVFLELGLAGEVSRAELLAACPAVLEASREGGLWRLKVENPRAALGQAVALAEARDLEISDVGLDRPSLEEAFLAYLEPDSGPEAVRP